MKKILKKSSDRLLVAAFLALIFIITFVAAVVGFAGNVNAVSADDDIYYTAGDTATTTVENTNNNIVYLSSLDFITENNWSYNGWSGHIIQKDKNQEGGALSLIVDGEKRTFAKGISLHARGQATYDISALSTDYPRFTAKIGVDASRGTNGSIKYTISVSDDGETWTSLLATNVLTGTSESVNVDLNVGGRRYLRIYVDPNGANTADHGTVANAKFVPQDYVNTEIFYDKIHKTEYYDEILREHDAEYNYNNNYRYILEREVVNKLGYWNIQSVAESNNGFSETFDWILSENKILEEVIEVGEITGQTVFMEVLSNLYHTYKADLETENGYVYEKMMIGLAAAYSTDTIASPLVYGHTMPAYDYILRYLRVKQLFEEDKFLHPDWFKEFHVEFMRSIMQDALRDDETMWFSNYVRVIKKYAMGPYSYMGYVKGNFVLPAYFEESNRETYDNKFHLSEFNVPYGDSPTARYWMVFQHGGICWNLARTGQSVQKILGLPAAGLFQPSHEAFLFYTQDAEGRGFWNIGNNNHGWGRSSTTWYGGKRYRLLFNWGAKSFVNHASTASAGGTNSGYQYLAQANLNRYDEFKKSLYLNLVANSYTDNEAKIRTYNKALQSIELNLDSYDYLIRAYKAAGNKTSAEWKELADRIINAYTFYPQAMYDLLKLIKPYLNGADLIDTDLKERAALVRASKATKDDIWQDLAARELANAHLGKTQANIASFSFDGENAGKIVINSAYDDYDFGWRYRLDGGTDSPADHQILDHSYQLSKEEIARITSANNIHIFIDGMSQSQPSFVINIEDGVLPDNLYGNDWENRVVGVNLTFEWRNVETDPWTSYAEASPNNTGNKTLHVRVGATSNRLPSPSTTFTFTEDNQPKTRKYIPVSHLSVEEYSTQSVDSARPFYAPNAIDGNANTLWHTDFRYSVLAQEQKPFLTIKLDKPRYISALEFKQFQYKNGDPVFIKNAIIYVSEDKENWTEAGRIENCPQNTDLKGTTFDKNVYGQYVKIEFETYGIFAAVSMVNIYQDISQNPRPTAGVGYSVTEPTNGNVVARLINVSVDNYEILSGGDTYVFTENGEYTFRFVDKETGIEGSTTAKVDWIDKTSPKATIIYSTVNPTSHTVIATLVPDEDVIITNNGEYEIAEDGKILDKEGNVIDGYTADENGNLLDKDGNIVANINKFTYEFLDNGEFTFEFVDKAGNRGSATAKVTWIDHEGLFGNITYNYSQTTDKDVVATLVFEDEGVRVTNNDGKLTYTFTENGEFTFEFEDVTGKKGTATAKVTWIVKDGGTSPETPPTDTNGKSNTGAVAAGVVIAVIAVAGGVVSFVCIKKAKKR